MRRFDSFDDFFRYYISQHSKPATRWVHFASTHAGAAIALVALLRRRPRMLLGAPPAVYGPAFLSHWLIEKNGPVTLQGNVLWAVRGDLRMIASMWRGHDAELTRIARQELGMEDGEAPPVPVPGAGEERRPVAEPLQSAPV